MITHSKQLIALLPLFILIFTTLISTISIALYRNHFVVSIISILGLIFSFCSLYFVLILSPIKITFLFYLDSNSIFYMGLIILASISTCFFSYQWLKNYSFNKEEFYLLILFSTLGSMGLIISNHMASFFISMELMSFPIIGLIAYSHYYKYSLEAALKYLILSGIASSFVLLGIAWIYSISGSLSFISITQALSVSSFDLSLMIFFGLFMIFFSLFFKLSIVPFHLWTADVYQGTPAVVLSFFTTVCKISTIFIFLRLFSYVSFFHDNLFYFIFSFFSFFSMIFGNIMAILQNNIKRFFGYLSISQIGYVLIAFLITRNNNLFSSEVLAIYFFGYILSNISFFGIMSLLSDVNKKKDKDIIFLYQGLFWYDPLLAGLMTIVLLSLAGIPLTLGFISKFYLLSIIVKEKLWFLGFSFFISSLLSLYCYLRIVLILYLNPLEHSKKNASIAKNWLFSGSGIIIFCTSMALLLLGIYPTPLIILTKLFLV